MEDSVSDKMAECNIDINEKEESNIGNKIEVPNIVNDQMEESNTFNQKTEESNDFNDVAETSVSTTHGETSDIEDLDISDFEEPSVSDNVPLNIDCNGRIVTKEVICDNEGDDCDIKFVEKNSVCLLNHRGSETVLHTSTEDLNVSDDEQSCVSALQSVNLDGLASTSSKKDTNILSTLNYSQTVFKNEINVEAEYFSDDEIRCALKEKSGGDDKLSKICPGLKLEGLLLTFRPSASFFSPSPQETADTFGLNDKSSNSILDKNEKCDPDVEQGSPSKTCFDFPKSDDHNTDADDHNTDAEDISIGSLDELIESSKNKNPFGKIYNAFCLPETVVEFSYENGKNDKHSYLGDSRRSSNAGFLTEDETLTLENFSDEGKKRIKKFDFTVSDKNEKSEDTLTDEEEILEDQ